MHVLYDNAKPEGGRPIGGVIGQLTRDAAGRVTAVTDANGNTTSYLLDSRDRVTAEIYPDGSNLTYTWDANDNLISRADPRGYVTTYTYDSANQLLQITLPDGAAVSLSYDQNGNIVQRQDATGLYQFVYDVMDRPVQIIQNGAVYKIGYDSDGRRLSVTFPDLRVTSMAYNAAGRPASVTTPDQGTTSFTYDGSGRRIGTNFPNGSTALAQYDLNSRLVRLVHQGASGANLTPDFRMVYDAGGNMLTVADGASPMWSYSYDNLNRLIQAVDQQNSITSNWTYDGLGNRLTATVGGVTTNYAYNSLNQLIQMGNTTLFWDGNGNLAQKVAPDGVTTYRFDSRDRLVEVGLPTTQKIRYGYDQQGRMITRQDAVGTTAFEWNGWLLERETDPTGHVTRYFYNGSEMVGFARDDQHYRVHTDWLSSVRSVTDQAGNKVFSAAYGPWGEQAVTDNVPSGGLAMRWIGARGVRWDAATGLYYMRNRFYDSQTPTFVSRDPVKASNLYTYVANNPISYIDPMGLKLTVNSSNPGAPGLSNFLNVIAGGAANSGYGGAQAYIQQLQQDSIDTVINLDATAIKTSASQIFTGLTFDNYFTGSGNTLSTGDFYSLIAVGALGGQQFPWVVLAAGLLVHALSESAYKAKWGLCPTNPNDPKQFETYRDKAHPQALIDENSVIRGLHIPGTTDVIIGRLDTGTQELTYLTSSGEVYAVRPSGNSFGFEDIGHLGPNGNLSTI